jgi:DNA-binding MarR family transcriptional regulator
MAIKLDLTRPLFLGAKAVRENTFNDQVRRAVAALDEGEGVPYAKLEDHLLRNYTPAKSANYGPSFIKSYVRDAVNKYDLLSYENGGHEYSADAAPAARTKTAEPRKPSKARVEQLEVLKFIRDAGEVADAGDVDNTQITAADIASELGKRRKTIDTKVEQLVTEGLARTEDEPTTGENAVVTHVYLTAAGLAAVNAMYPEGAESSEGAAEGGADVEEVLKEA